MLTVTNLHYQYGPNHVLDDLSLHLDKGQIALLIGRNGAGKSTLLRCLAGWTKADEGEIVINDVPMREERRIREQVVFVPDTPDFYDELTAWEHLQLTAQLRRIPQWEPRATALLQRFQLDHVRNNFPFSFSRGMRYKLAVCLALLVRPPLLLLDEPFGTLDAAAVRDLWRDLQVYRHDGNSILLSSHMIPGGNRADVVFLLQEGEVTELAGEDVPDLAEALDNAP